MADYDVGVVALVTPPAIAVVTPYRPAVSVRNNGVHDALASGYLRIYDAAGLLIFTTELYSGNIVPGDTGLAQAVDYWTPPAEGKYMIFGFVTCPLDQYEPNNHLAPRTITVSGAPPPPPTPVPLHAAQHEEGGADEASIDGLHGLSSDPQTPRPHVAAHQAAGADQLNVGALLGVLAQDQPPQPHGNPKHSPSMATSAELSTHLAATSVHTAAANLANRDTTGPEAGLVNGAQLGPTSEFPNHPKMALTMDRMWSHPRHAALGANMIITLVQMGTTPMDILQLAVPEAWLSDDMQFIAESHAYVSTPGSAGGTVQLDLMLGDLLITSAAVDFEGLGGLNVLAIRAGVSGLRFNRVTGFLETLSVDPATSLCRFAPSWDSQNPLYTPGDLSLHVLATLISADPLFALSAYGGIIRALYPIP